jgi:hypothetical protein
MSPILAASLSVVPGVGHWVVGRRGKAAAFFAIDLGILCTVLFLRSPIALFLACVTYLMIMVPAVIETYTIPRGGESQFSESKPYIVLLLLVTGLTALPLLWQSRLFSKRVKILWSIVVPVLAILWFGFLGTYGIRLFNYAKSWLS